MYTETGSVRRPAPTGAVPNPGSPATPGQELDRLIEHRLIHPVFQPILGFGARSYLGFEALARGPNDSPLHLPQALFDTAQKLGRAAELDRLCREQALRAFAARGLAGKLFINIGPAHLADPALLNGDTLLLLRELGLSPSRIVMEVTENQKITDFAEARDLLAHYRGLGYEVAIDDLGEGFSNLRVWTELHPQYVKIDRHFIHGICDDALKFQLVRSIHGFAEACSAHIIAEGIETETDFTAVRDLGLAYGQGWFIARPQEHPPAAPSPEVQQALAKHSISVFPGMQAAPVRGATTRTVATRVEPVSPDAGNEAVYRRFEHDPDEYAIPVVKDGFPVGLINRYNLIDRFARPYCRELYGKRSCAQFMDPAPLIVDHAISVQELGRLISRAAKRHMHDGFIVTEDGRYLGVGHSQDLMALITEMQITAARYANPLTQLPGNVPIDEHIDRLLEGSVRFAAAYCDLDRFKPFNDVYGYRRGDDLIRIVAQILVEHVDGGLDFVGHIGGDDFLVLFQSADWAERSQRIIDSFDERARALFAPEDLARGGLTAEDRLGRSQFFPLPALSIGVVNIEPGSYTSHHEISVAAAEAKKLAKREVHSSIFVERRQPLRSQAA